MKSKYSEAIVSAYNNWMEIIGNEPDYDYEDFVLYKKWKGQNRRAADRFEKLCKAEGLNYVVVSMDLTAHNLRVN